MEKNYNGIVIFGEMGAGKDVLAEQFKSLGKNAKIYNMGILCREMMKVAKVNPKWKGLERYIGQTTADKLREMDINIMCDYILALIYESGQKYYDFETFDMNQLFLMKTQELPIIVGGRTTTDLDYWKEKNFLILGISVSEEIRRTRLVARDGEKVARNSSSTHNTEADAAHIVKNLCHETILNDGTLEDLKNKAEEVLSKYKL
jgi:dephospho-CoA kinase